MEANEDAEMLQKQVKAFKLLKYQEGYNDERQGKALMYPLDIRSSHIKQNSEIPPRDGITDPNSGVAEAHQDGVSA